MKINLCYLFWNLPIVNYFRHVTDCVFVLVDSMHNSTWSLRQIHPYWCHSIWITSKYDLLYIVTLKELFCDVVPMITLFTYVWCLGFDFRAISHCLTAEPWPHRTQAHFLRIFLGKRCILWAIKYSICISWNLGCYKILKQIFRVCMLSL